MNELITVQQLPVIEEKLKSLSEEIKQKTANALALECNQDTVKEVKAIRADLTKGFNELENRRKEVKAAVLAPYDEFEAIYKQCVSGIYKQADNELKRKINDVEDGLREEKECELRGYYSEYVSAQDMDLSWLSYEQVGLNVTLTASMKSLREAVKACVDKVCSDLRLIDTQEHSKEIFVEYKKSLNVSNAITAVISRHKEIERLEEERKDEESEARVFVAPKHDVYATKTVNEPLTEDKKIFQTWNFQVTATKETLEALEEFIKADGYDVTVRKGD